MPAPRAWEDENRHMNVRFYFDLSIQGLRQVIERLGIDRNAPDRLGTGLFTTDHHLTYRAEVLSGDAAGVHFCLLDHSNKTLHGMLFVVNESKRSVASTMEFVTLHMDLNTRRPTPFTAETHRLVAAESQRYAGLDWESPLCGRIGVRRSSRGHEPSPP